MSAPMLLSLMLAAWLPAPTPQGEDLLVHRDGRMFAGVSIAVEGDSVVVGFEHGNVEVPMSDVEDLVLQGGSVFEPETDDERERLAKGQVRYKGKWMSVSSRDSRVAKDRAALREQIEERIAGRLWRNRQILETKNFVFESTAPPHITQYYAELSEAYFQEFAKTWKIKRGKAGKLTVKFFVDQENYLQVTGASPYTLAFFRFIEPYELCVFYDRLAPLETEETLFHELGHYLQKLIDIEFAYPHWPGEALSEYYGASSWDPVKKKVEVGKILAGRTTEVLFDIAEGDHVSIDTLLKGAPDRTYHDYTWGWTFVHFMMSEKRYRKNFTKFYTALAKAKDVDRSPFTVGRTTLKSLSGESMDQAFRKYMKIKSNADLAEMQQAWYAHIEESLVLDSSRGLETAALKNLQQGRRIRARRLFEEAIEKGSRNSYTFFRYAELLEDLEEYDLARENWELAIEADPLVSDYYVSLGRFMVRQGNQEEYDAGENLLRLALDIEPENFYLERYLDEILRSGKRILNKALENADDDEEDEDEEDDEPEDEAEPEPEAED